jgi:putative tryptophan/tyrosine transport system substrate-binding protein
MQIPARSGRLSRRAFVGGLTGLGASAAGLVLVARCGLVPGATAKHARIGLLTAGTAPSAPEWQAFLGSLREYGWVEGQNLALDWRVDVEALAQDVTELVRAPVDLIVVVGIASIAAKATTATVPIVLANVARPVEQGLVSSLAQPGGNVTGVAASADDAVNKDSLPLKVLDLARQVVPALMRVTHFEGALSGGGTSQLSQMTSDQLRTVGTSLGLQVQISPVRSAADLDRAFDAASAWGSQALLVVHNQPFASFSPERIPQLAARHQLPDFYFPRRANVDAGGLMSYGPNIPNQFRRAAYFVDRILRGAKPADLPVEQPTVFDLVINGTTATALGLTIPPDVAAQVTEWVH